MRINEAFPSKYLKADDLDDGDMTLTIKAERSETMGEGAGAQQKVILTFKETDKEFVCNKTNFRTIAKLTECDDSADWIGKQITLYPAEVEFQGETMLGIRVRLRNPKAATVDNSGNGGVTMAGLLAKFKELYPDTEDGLLKDMFKKRVEADFGSGKKSLTPAEMQTLALALDAEIVFG
jgi:hypothetical protein